jgi:2-hydroxychromene-2-carboxylate isomerase
MSATLEFWYDFSSPFSYLASTQVEALAKRAGAALEWRPMLLGALFKQIGGPDLPIRAASPAKQRWYALDLTYWADIWGVPFRWSSHFPLRTVTPLRLALLAEERVAELSHAIFEAAWVHDQDVADSALVGPILSRLGCDAEAMLAATQRPEVKARLIEATAEAVRRDIFGAPTFIVRRAGEPDLLFWGQDRLVLVEKALGGWRPRDAATR